MPCLVVMNCGYETDCNLVFDNGTVMNLLHLYSKEEPCPYLCVEFYLFIYLFVSVFCLIFIYFIYLFIYLCI